MSISVNIIDDTFSIEEKINFWKKKGYTENDRTIRDLIALDIIESGKLIELCKNIIDIGKEYEESYFYDRENEESFKELLKNVFQLHDFVDNKLIFNRCKDKIESLDLEQKITIYKAFKIVSELFSYLTADVYNCEVEAYINNCFEESKEYIKELLNLFSFNVPQTDQELNYQLKKYEGIYFYKRIHIMEGILRGSGVNV